jgi:hypothetical protein
LYDEDLDMIENIGWSDDNPATVVVNVKTKGNHKLATVKNIMLLKEYKGHKITAEVVGVVNMNPYITRENEKVRQKELVKKKAAIEKELEAEINKKKSVEYYVNVVKITLLVREIINVWFATIDW